MLIGLAAAAALCARLVPRVRMRIVTRKLAPPLNWFVAADVQTKDSVQGAVTTGMRLARSQDTAALKRNALRQVAFTIPYDVARLNTDAPNFVLKKLGPCAELSFTTQAIVDRSAKDSGHRVLVDIAKDTRLFLYYTTSEPGRKATAAIVAINTDVDLPTLTKTQKQAMRSGSAIRTEQQTAAASANYVAVLDFATKLWINQFDYWRKENPAIIDRLAPGPFPVIFVVRDTACGCLFDQERGLFKQEDLFSLSKIIVLRDVKVKS